MKKANNRQEGRGHSVLDENRDKGVPIGGILGDLEYLRTTDHHRAFINVMYLTYSFRGLPIGIVICEMINCRVATSLKLFHPLLSLST